MGNDSKLSQISFCIEQYTIRFHMDVLRWQMLVAMLTLQTLSNAQSNKLRNLASSIERTHDLALLLVDEFVAAVEAEQRP